MNRPTTEYEIRILTDLYTVCKLMWFDWKSVEINRLRQTQTEIQTDRQTDRQKDRDRKTGKLGI